MANQVSFAHSDRIKESSQNFSELRERPVPHLFRRTPMPGQIQSIHRMVGCQLLVVEHPGVEISAETMNQNRSFGSFATAQVADAESVHIRRFKDWTGNFFVGLLGNVVGLKVRNITIDLRVGSGGTSNYRQ